MIVGTSLVSILIILISILIAMSVHEAMHAFVSLQLGDTTAAEQGRISLNPLHHIDPITTVLLPVITLLLFHVPILAARPVPFNPSRVRYGEFGAALVALAGPISNLVLAIIGAVAAHAFASTGSIATVFGIFVQLNVALFIFNLVPIPPLDGSRVLYALAPESLQRVIADIEPYGLMIIFALVLLGGFGGVLITLNDFVLRLLL